MSERKRSRPFYWESFSNGTGWRNKERPEGRDLAALRRGGGREPGVIPEMWHCYTRFDRSGKISPLLRAEHICLTLYGVHQQGESIVPVHKPKIHLGSAVAILRDSGRHSPDAVERRFVAAATSSDASELAIHLRSLVRLLKTLPRAQPFDYTGLCWDLFRWQDPGRRDKVRREWGANFYWHLTNVTTKPSTSKES